MFKATCMFNCTKNILYDYVYQYKLFRTWYYLPEQPKKR